MCQTLWQNGVAVLYCNLGDFNEFVGGGIKVQQPTSGLVQGHTWEIWDAEPWKVRKALLQLYQEQRKQKTLNPVAVVIDEAQLVAPRGSFMFPEAGEINEDNIVGVLCTTGLRYNIRLIWITQRPQFVDTGVYRTARYHIFFTCDPADVVFFRQQGIVFANPPWHQYVVVRS